MKRHKLKRAIRHTWRVVCEKGAFNVEADGKTDAAKFARLDTYLGFGQVVRVERVA